MNKLGLRILAAGGLTIMAITSLHSWASVGHPFLGWFLIVGTFTALSFFNVR